MKTGSFMYARKRNSTWRARLFLPINKLGYDENKEGFMLNNG